MTNLAEILSQLDNNNDKYYYIKNRQLLTLNNNWNVLQNDNNSTLIKIILPKRIDGINIDKTYKFYIDFLDGKNRPGIIEYKDNNIISKPILTDEKGNEVTEEYNYIPEDNMISIGSYNGIIDKNNKVIVNNKEYFVTFNKDYLPDKTYDNKNIGYDFENSNDISKNYPNGYAKATYNKKFNKNLTVEERVGLNEKEDNIPYIEINWTLDQNITQFAGKVSFSIRIEKENNNFKWQSDIGSFEVLENLNDSYYLKDEIEENFIIQNRTIKPVGDFNPILVKGDSNSNTLYYKMNRYFQGQDMLAEDVTVNKLENGAIIQNVGTVEEPIYKYQNIQYKVDNGNIVNKKNTAIVYAVQNNQVNINQINYTINLYKEFNIVKKEYINKIEFINESQNITTQELDNNYHGVILLNEEEYEVYLTNPLAIGYTESKQSEAPEVSNARILPVYNRSVRFVFLSNNKDYGDWAEGQIEYVNNNYFVFSWTPDNRVTRSAGQVGYYIEFFLNHINSNSNTNQTYSWSTLPTTITIEDNAVGSATVDFLPHWVNYIENSIQDDINSFMKGDLQEQYNNFENLLLQNIFKNYNLIEVEKNDDNNFKFVDEGNTYSIKVIKKIVDKNISYDFYYSILKDKEEQGTPEQKIEPITIKNNSYYGFIDDYNFSYDSVLNLVIILKAQSSGENDKDNYKPLIPVFWETLEKIKEIYNNKINSTEKEFKDYKNLLQNNFGYEDTKTEDISLKEELYKQFNSLFTILEFLCNGNNRLIQGLYEGNNEPIRANNNIIRINNINYTLSTIFSDGINGELTSAEFKINNTMKYEDSLQYYYYLNEREKTDKIYIKDLFYKVIINGEEKYIPYKNNEDFKILEKLDNTQNDVLNIYINSNKSYQLINNVFFIRKIRVSIAYTKEDVDKQSSQGKKILLLSTLRQDFEQYKTVTNESLNTKFTNETTKLKENIDKKIEEIDQEVTNNINEIQTAISEQNANYNSIEFNQAFSSLAAYYAQNIEALQMQQQQFVLTVDDTGEGILHINII